MIRGEHSAQRQQSKPAQPGEGAPEVRVSCFTAGSEVSDWQQCQELYQHSFRTAEVLGTHAPLGCDPCWNQQCGQRCLNPVAQQGPREDGSDGPEQDSAGPVLLKIENLPGEKYACT